MQAVVDKLQEAQAILDGDVTAEDLVFVDKRPLEVTSEKDIEKATEKLLKPPAVKVKPPKKKKRRLTKLTDEEKIEEHRRYNREWARKKAAEKKTVSGKKKSPEMSKEERLKLMKELYIKRKALKNAEEIIDAEKDTTVDGDGIQGIPGADGNRDE